MATAPGADTSTLRCDFGIPSHEIDPAEVIVVPASEVSEYARAYAEMLTAQFPLVRQLKPLRDIVRFAREKAVNTGGIMHGQHGDWACCTEHHRVWKTFKTRFPASRYPKGTEL